MPRTCPPATPQVLRRFLSVLGSFDWERYALALQGPLPLAELHSPRGEERQGQGRADLQGSWCSAVLCRAVVQGASTCLPTHKPGTAASLLAVDLSAMPGGATPLLDDAFMQEASAACVAGPSTAFVLRAGLHSGCSRLLPACHVV